MISVSAFHARAILDGRKTQLRRLLVDRVASSAPGDLHWLREPWAFRHAMWDALAPLQAIRLGARGTDIVYLADGADEPHGRNRFAREMPRAFSRATLRVTQRRLEPLQAIDEAGAAAEGWTATRASSARAKFVADWDLQRRLAISGNSPRYAWEANPKVAVIAFELIRANIDALSAVEAAA